MNRDRFELALKQLSSHDGFLFEQLASAFAVIEFGELRTVASVGGDGGRDAILYSSVDDSAVIFQYSVTTDYAGKILRTAKRLATTTPDARELIYVTNQEIGTKVDEAKRRLRREYKLSLDVWDRGWFLDRVNLHSQTEEAAESLARIKVDPLAAAALSRTRSLPSLSSDEEREAAFFLELNYGDEDRHKGLTKVGFDSLVRAALRQTDSGNRMSRSDVHERVSRMLPAGRDYNVAIDSSLKRLSKGAIRHWARADEFCLSHESVLRLREKMGSYVLIQQEFKDAVQSRVLDMAAMEGESLSSSESASAVDLVEMTLDRILLERGKSFAEALITSRVSDYQSESIEPMLERAIRAMAKKPSGKSRRIVSYVISSIISDSTGAVREYMRGRLESYTLFSLLQATPDVQKTVVKLFSGGTIWLDANLILPVVAEDLAEEKDRSYTRMLEAARTCGISLRVTRGVVEELSSHMRRSLAYARVVGQGKAWDGDVPFLASAHAASGEPAGALGSWLERFRGTEQPIEDVLEYLEEVHGVRVKDLHDEAEAVDVEIRGAVQEIWYEARARRTQKFSPATIQVLVNHDVECYLGVVHRRRRENRSPLGFNSWWLTLDGTAFKMHGFLKERLVQDPPSPPVMSPDFLLRYLELGPLRAQVSNDMRHELPVMLDVSFLEGVSPHIMQVVEKVRVEHGNLPGYVLRRKIRDTVNRLKSERGRIAEGGVALVEQEVLESINAKE
ncbi:hypothetical protein MMF93_22840 [Streptomyces tubbatahanensis]|uniref:Restriction endonuclease type IV Mrr domain-containing protein n=1 Tax=Streptomyces tubbatahanensis TaxID=2923272 RepID=A0ABY3XXB6_9ACTN|nr:hypothetical protein [Streptomyces tubbatahanensis]UNS98976.1 hypothetical protein MMF93_22840 [Streptomyces tubbatahanensis]